MCVQTVQPWALVRGYLDEIFDARVLVHVDDSFHPDERLDLRTRVAGGHVQFKKKERKGKPRRRTREQ